MIFLQLAYWEMYSYEYTYFVISGFSPTKIAKNLAKLLTTASTVG